MSVTDVYCCKCNWMWPRDQLSPAAQACWDKISACKTRITPDGHGRPLPPQLPISTDVDMQVVEKPPEATVAELQQELADIDTLFGLVEKYDGASAVNSLTDKQTRRSEIVNLIAASKSQEDVAHPTVNKLSQLVRSEVVKQKAAAARVEKSRDRIKEIERDLLDAKACLEAAEEHEASLERSVADLSLQLTAASSKSLPPVEKVKLQTDQIDEVAGQVLTAMHDNINAICSTQAAAMQQELTRILALFPTSDEHKAKLMEEAEKNTTFNTTFIAEMESKLRSQTEEAAGSLLKRAKVDPPAGQAAADIAKAAEIRARAEAGMVG